MNLTCKYCNEIFYRKRPKNAEFHFCDSRCYKLWRQDKAKINVCKQCGKKTTNKVFCCRSCSAVYNNKMFPKRRPETQKYSKCVLCGIEIQYRRKYCTKCNTQNVDWSTIKLKDAIYGPNQVHSNRYTKIRDHAKRFYKSSGLPQSCIICGYDKHFEICHINPISAFDSDTPISEINSMENLIALCPNCHWELDHGLLELVPPQGLEPRTLH